MSQAVAALWDSYPSFREAVRGLLRLSADQLKQLESLTESGFEVEPPRAAAELDIAPIEAQAVLRVTSTLYGAARMEELTGREVVDALVELALPDEESATATPDDERVEILATIFDRREAVDVSRTRKLVEGSFLPVLEAVEIGVDLRVSSDENGEGERPFNLVPIAVARLVFDEAAGGSNVVHFQMPSAMIKELLEQVREVEGQMDTIISSALSEWLL